ncbi:MAG: hypothetical protein ACI4DU_06620 [Lachnospiraceae bacterium]
MLKNSIIPSREYLHIYLENAIVFLVSVMFLVEWLGAYLIVNIWLGNRLWWWAGCIWIVGGFVATGITRNISPKLWIQLPMHFIFFALLFVYQVFFAGSIVHSGFWGMDILGCIFMQILLSLVTALQNWKGNQTYLPYEIKPYLLIAPIILYFYGRYTKQVPHVICALTMLVLLVVLHILCEYFQGTIQYLQRNRDVTDLPDSYLFYRNSKRVVCSLLFVVAVCILAGFLQFDFILVRIAKWIGVGIGCFFQFVNYMYQCFLRLMERLGMEKSMVDYSWWDSMLYIWQSRNLEWLYRLLAILIIAGFSFLFVRQAMKFFSSKEETAKEEWSAAAQLYRDRVEDIRRPAKQIRDTRPKDAREMVRWQFRRKVRKKYKTNIPRQKTPKELLMLDSGMEEEEQLLRLYHKARYSEEKNVN